MKQTILNLTLSLFVGNLLLISCQEKNELVKPLPQTPPPALSPKAILKLPVVLFRSAKKPMAVFLLPAVL